MRNGSTRRIATDDSAATSFEEWLSRWRATLVVTSGDAAGSEYVLDTPSISIGRGIAATWVFEDESMSSEHAAIEFSGSGMRLRDLGSTNGCWVNGSPMQSADLKHGDRIELGRSAFQILLEERERDPRTYVVEAG